MMSRVKGLLLGRSIHGRVGRFLILVGLIPLLALATYIAVSQRAVLSSTASENLSSHASLRAASVERVLRDAAKDVEVIAANPALRSPGASNEEMSSQLKEAQGFYDVFEDITIVDTKGNVIDSTSYLYSGTWPEKDWFKEALAGRSAISEAHFIPSPSRMVVVFTAPIISEGKVSAVVAGQMNMERVWEILDEVHIGKSGFLIAVDRNGNLVSHPDKGLLLTKLEGDVGQTGSAVTSIEARGSDGESLTGESAPVGLLGWRVIALQDTSETFALVDDLVQKVAIAVLVVLVLSGGAMIVFSREIGRAEHALQLTQFSVDHTADAVFWMSPDGRFVDVNDAACRALGYSRGELLAMSVHDIDPDFPDEIWPDHWAEIKQRGSFTLESRHRSKGGRIFPVDVTVNYLEFNGKEYNCAFARDITERKRAEQALQESESKFRTLAETSPAATFIVRGTRLVYVNPAAEAMTGRSREELLAMSFWEVIHPDIRQTVTERGMARQRGEHVPSRYEHKILTKNGEECWVDLAAASVEFEGRPAMLGTAFDITERKRAEETIRHLAYHDALTDLPNRTLFQDRLTVALAQARRKGRMVAVLFLDLDQFKVVNDTVGHAEGDRLLRQVAERLAGLVREGDTVGRVGGDEFVLLLSETTQVEDAVEVAERILEGLRQPWTLQGQEFRVTTSIGVAMYPGDGEDAESLLRNADTAMYRAKEHGRDNYQLYTPAMNARIAERLALENSLRHGLERGEFVVYYQPQVNIGSGRVAGVEALVRWEHPERGLVLPAEFIPAAEETGLIVPLGEWVLRTACAQNKAWQEEGLPAMRVAVNLSARQFQQRNLMEVVARVLQETGLAPHLLQFEITEGIAMHDVDFTVSMLRRLRAMGVQFAIDDFGTGYSSLAYLKRFPIDAVKIDRSFVSDLTVDADDAAIASTVITMAHSLKLSVIAEGVETEEQLAFLSRRRCDEMQGYLFSRPVPAEEIATMIPPIKRSSRAKIPADSP
jgi:diguanylate cyclase (GGDEF)-like protein/PAS domain S-box-containing protein